MSRTSSFVCIAAGWLLTFASLADAEVPLPSREVNNLRSVALQLAQQPPDPAATIQLAHQELLDSVRQLEQFLAGGGLESAARWSAWLALPTLREELARATPDLDTLRAIEERFYQNQLGLELPQFVQVRRQLREYFTARQYAAVDSPQELYRQQMAELEQRLERLATVPNEDDAHRAGQLLAWVQPLDSRGEALARDARRELCRINAVAQGSG